MAITHIFGFEGGSLHVEPTYSTAVFINTGVGVGSWNLEGTIVHTGSGSLKLTPTSGSAGYWDLVPTVTFNSSYVRFYIRVTSLPSANRMLFGDISNIHLKLNSFGTLSLYNGGTNLGTSSQALSSTTTWYRVELKVIANSQELKIDGTSEVTATVASPVCRTIFGANDTVSSTYTAYIDDIVRNDSAYPGEGKVVLLVPISDNARDTLWTGGAGGTTNLWQAVDNRPPVGALTETNLTQIEHAGGASGTTDRYDANMTSYSTAGLGSSDTVNAIATFCWMGEDVSTGTKLLSFQCLSNPVGTSSGSVDVAPTSGALENWPSQWFVRSVVDSTPSVTIANSPVMRVVRPETASRVASVCFMGIYVDYTPFVAPPAGAAIMTPNRGMW